MGLDEWRSRIDEIDRQLLRLLSQRAELSLEIGRAKRQSGEPVLVPEREQEILDELTRLNSGPLPPGAVRAIWSEKSPYAMMIAGVITASVTAYSAIVWAPSRLQRERMRSNQR